MARSKCARFEKLVTRTPAAVGPGSYDVYESPKPPRDLENEYPFLSGTIRKTLQISNDAASFPGPGNYDPVEPRRHVPERILQPGGVSIGFTDIRLKPKTYEGPGPETYSLPDNHFGAIKPGLRVHPGTWRGTVGKLWRGNPPRSIMPSAASVPSKPDENGYDISGGILVKNPPTECVPIDFYDIPRGEPNFTTSRYKGNSWSMMAGRDESKIDETPGPGAYELDRPIDPARVRDEAFRSMKRAASRQTRYLDELWRRKLLENLPAPNCYKTPKGPFDKDLTCDCDNHVVEPPPFGRSAKRFQGKIAAATPGPDAYNPHRRKTVSCSKLFMPFGALASRFGRSTDSSTPGPGSYDLTKDDLARRISAIRRRSYARPSARHSRSEGSSGSIRHEEPAGEYTVTPDPWANKSRVHHAVFKSATPRFKDARPRANSGRYYRCIISGNYAN